LIGKENNLKRKEKQKGKKKHNLPPDFNEQLSLHAKLGAQCSSHCAREIQYDWSGILTKNTFVIHIDFAPFFTKQKNLIVFFCFCFAQKKTNDANLVFLAVFS